MELCAAEEKDVIVLPEEQLSLPHFRTFVAAGLIDRYETTGRSSLPNAILVKRPTDVTESTVVMVLPLEQAALPHFAIFKSAFVLS